MPCNFTLFYWALSTDRSLRLSRTGVRASVFQSFALSGSSPSQITRKEFNFWTPFFMPCNFMFFWRLALRTGHFGFLELEFAPQYSKASFCLVRAPARSLERSSIFELLFLCLVISRYFIGLSLRTGHFGFLELPVRVSVFTNCVLSFDFPNCVLSFDFPNFPFGSQSSRTAFCPSTFRTSRSGLSLRELRSVLRLSELPVRVSVFANCVRSGSSPSQITEGNLFIPLY